MFFTLVPTGDWQDLGIALPSPLPDRSVAQSALITLDDSSKILNMYHVDFL